MQQNLHYFIYILMILVLNTTKKRTYIILKKPSKHNTHVKLIDKAIHFLASLYTKIIKANKLISACQSIWIMYFKKWTTSKRLFQNMLTPIIIWILNRQSTVSELMLGTSIYIPLSLPRKKQYMYQIVVGTFLYYTWALDNKMLRTSNDTWTQQAYPIQKIMEKIQQLLDYGNT